jgi:hypothetical protein
MTNAIETYTTWGDSGYDCDHCGGRLLKRTDAETGQPDRHCYQCEQCGCQWSLDRRPLRVGKSAECRKAQVGRIEEEQVSNEAWVRLLTLGLFVLAGFFLFRFGGPALVRLLAPALVVGVLVFVMFRFARRRDDA